MKRCCIKSDAKGVFPEMAQARHDPISAELVEKGIALQEACGTTYAAKYLQTQWIGMNVALRVLARPNQRRRCNYDGKVGAFRRDRLEGRSIAHSG